MGEGVTIVNFVYPGVKTLYKNFGIFGKKAFLEYLSRVEKILFNDKLVVGQTPSEIILEIEKVKVIHYKPLKRRFSRVPLLLITPILSKPYILDLYPGFSFIEYLVNQGIDVYLVDFGVPDEEDRNLAFEDYVFRYIPSAIERVLETSSSKTMSLLGYCLGGVFTLLYAAFNDKKPIENIVLLASPVDFSKLDLHYYYWRNIDVDRLVDTFGNIPPELIIFSFNVIAGIKNPFRYLKKTKSFLQNIKDREYMKRELLINRWLIESIPFPAKAFKQLIKKFFYENVLVKKRLRMGGKSANLSRIECPILILSHSADVVAPPESAQGLLQLISSHDKEMVEVSGGDAGHIDIVIGTEGREVTWPKIASWLNDRSNQN
ncbi:MAG: alpha/beta fold hydrolase [Deltaproteobacteria bacterium]|nr:alpha/beta fold hydrolase [Deltaproteobacteria bacterium]